MRIRLLSPAVAVVAAGALAAPVAASADPAVDASATKRCALKGTTTVKKNRFGRVFERTLRNGDSRLYGCLYRKNRRVLLDTTTGDREIFGEYYEAIKLHGRFVAWKRVAVEDSGCRAQPECTSDDGGGTSTSVAAGSLDRGLHKEYVGTPDTDRGLVVTSRGGIAWIEDGNVSGADWSGERVFYAGGDARPGSLRAGRSRVTWIADGRRMSGVLGGLFKKKGTSCSVKRSKTVRLNRFVRVYTTPRARGTDEVGRLHACLRATGRKIRLDTARDDDLVSSESFNAVKLNGRFVAWHHSSYDISCKAACPPGYDPSQAELRVVNVRTRKRRVVEGELGEGTALVVTRTGAIAWIQPGSPVSVRASDADGTRVLYAGDDIDGASLSLSGNTVAWVAGGQARSAVLR